MMVDGKSLGWGQWVEDAYGRLWDTRTAPGRLAFLKMQARFALYNGLGANSWRYYYQARRKYAPTPNLPG